MSNSQTSEAKELALVGKVELKIALTQSDSALQSILTTYLPPLLLKLSSESISVRNKVISICQHINTRIKPPSIRLPVATLLKQFKDQQNNLIRHFDLLYVQQGVSRLPTTDRLALLPVILSGLHANYQESPKHAATLFNLFLKLLHSMTLPSRGSDEDLKLRDQLNFNSKPEDGSFVAAWLGKLVLYSPIKHPATREPGLSEDECNFLQLFGKSDTWNPAASDGMNISEIKVVAVRFLASGAFTETERFLPALFASADTNSRVSDVGNDMLKRATSAMSLEDPELVRKLYAIYLGSRGERGSLPVRPGLQAKILTFLARSKAASSFIKESVQIVQEGLASQPSFALTASIQGHKGLEISRLRGQIFAFTNWLARISSANDIADFAPTLVGHLRIYVEDQGWPRPRTEEPLSAGELASRSYAYESIGLLAAACAQKLLLEPSLELLRWLMTSLSEDSSGKEVSLSIENSLSSVIQAFGGPLKPELQEPLATLFMHHMSLIPDSNNENSAGIVRSTRFVAVRFANRCLPYSSIDGRYIDVLSLCGQDAERSEVLEEGKKGLDPYWHCILNPRKGEDGANLAAVQDIDFPALDPLVERLLGSNAAWDLSNARLANAFATALGYCRCALLHRALSAVGSPPVVDGNWERNIDALIGNNEGARNNLAVHFRDQFEKNASSSQTISTYLHACFKALTSHSSRDASLAGQYLVEISSFLPQSQYVGLSTYLDKLQDPIFSTNSALSKVSSLVFGLLASLGECRSNVLHVMLRNFEQRLGNWEAAIGTDLFKVHGSLLAKAFFLTRSARRNTQATDFEGERTALRKTCLSILSSSSDKLLLEGVFVAISELSLYGVLTNDYITPMSNDMVQSLYKNGEKGNEKAITALGHLAMQCGEGQSEDSILETIIDRLHQLHNVRQPEVQFAVGEAFSCAAIGWDSKALLSTQDISGPLPPSANRNSTIRNLLERTFADCKSTKPALRQATVIRLLCLVQFCGHHTTVQRQLRECQAAFKGFLADRETLNQESASRGLTLVYEKGDKQLKEDLIRDLVGSFTGTTSTLAGSVSQDTELFDPGALPTGDGSVRTYKDIMSLASEVGDSSLVYRFMSLASHNAIWSSRAAFGRFGLSNILSDASVDGYLSHNPKLYPALFRYRFDPNTGVQNAMNDIWSALVKDSTTTINTHLDAIMKDILKNILNKEWRTRQASCAAIADLVQGRPLEMYEHYLNEIWSLAFKVCDDIKESVRTAAMSLARVLTGILTRSLEAGDSSAQTADKMLKQVLPFLLSTQGLESGAAEVQDFSRKTILQIIKKSNGKTLRPFVPELVGRLLALLSSIEPEMVNYVHMNAETFGLTKQELDDARLKHIRGSSMLEAIERCLDYLDESSMPKLQQTLENAIKTVIGLPSKVGCSRVLVSLSTSQNFIFRPYADQFLVIARKQVFDNNDTISSAYAIACGYLARLASENALLKLAHGCRTLYFDSEEDRSRIIAGDLVYAFSKHATDRFNSLATEVFPFVFIAKHDLNDRARSLFQDTWNENVGGSRAVLLYLKEIVQLASQYLNATRWSIKLTSAFAVADVIMSAGATIGDVDARTIWPVLEQGLSGKTWEGKEKVLQAFVTFVKHSKLKEDPKVAAQMSKIMLREAKRNNPAYRQHALGCLADFVEIQHSASLYEEVHSTTSPIFDELLSGSDDMDVESANGGPSSKVVKDLTVANAIKASLQSNHPQDFSDTDWIKTLMQGLVLLDMVDKTERGSKAVQTAVYDSLKSLFQKWQQAYSETLPSPLEETCIGYIKHTFNAQDQVENIRLKAAEAALEMAAIARKGDRTRAIFSDGLGKAKATERSGSVLQILDRAAKAFGKGV